MTTASNTRAAWSEPLAAHQIVHAYHERTKHRLGAFAAGPETLDWDSQPAAFRHFDGAPTTALPRDADHAISTHARRPFAAVFDPGAPLAPSLSSLGALLQLSLGITAWKSFGPDRWAVRANPSSGNLHPVEGYVILRGIPGLSAGVYHYCPDDHALERRAQFTSALDSPPVLWIALSTIIWREAWKYGERAFRYCQLDTGHAIAALHYAGALLGWRLSEQPQVGSATLAIALGLDRPEDFPVRRRPDTELEEAEVLLSVSLDGHAPSPVDPVSLRELASSALWSGVASTIDAHPMYRWPILNDVAMATRTPDGSAASRQAPPDLPKPRPPRASSIRRAADVILGRRSAQRFDSRHQVSRKEFFGLMDALLPRVAGPWSVLARSHRLDLVLAVHRVAELESGLYVLSRPLGDTPALVSELARHFELVSVQGTAPDLDLRRMATAESRALTRLARSLHCHQDIAAQACFALGMVAEFDAAIEQSPANYRSLHREAGSLGHVLYLEAEALGLRGTGIGCFFDDALHDLLKLSDTRFQTLYHFAVGKPIDDPRLESTAGTSMDLREHAKGSAP